MINRLSILALIFGAVAAAQIGFSGPSDTPTPSATRFSASDVPALSFGTEAARWILPES